MSKSTVHPHDIGLKDQEFSSVHFKGYYRRGIIKCLALFHLKCLALFHLVFVLKIQRLTYIVLLRFKESFCETIKIFIPHTPNE